MAFFNAKLGSVFEGYEGLECALCDVIVAPALGDYTLPSTACANANEGDIICIAPGTYNETTDIDMKDGQVLIAFGNNYGSVTINMGTDYQIIPSVDSVIHGVTIVSSSTGAAHDLIDFDTADNCILRYLNIDISAAENVTVFAAATTTENVVIDSIDFEGNNDNTGTANRLFNTNLRRSRISNINCVDQHAPTGGALDNNLCHLIGPIGMLTGGYNTYDNFNITLPSTQLGTADRSRNYVMYIRNKKGVAQNIVINNLGTGSLSCNGIALEYGELNNFTVDGIDDDGTNGCNIGLYIVHDGGYVDVSNGSINAHIPLYVENGYGNFSNLTLISEGGGAADSFFSLYIADGEGWNRFVNIEYSDQIYIGGNYCSFINFMTEDAAEVEVAGQFNYFNNWIQEAINQVVWTVNAGAISNRFDNIFYNTFTDNGTFTIINSMVKVSGTPGVNDDIDDGFLINDIWEDTDTGFLYQCQDNSAGVAVWNLLWSGGAGGYSFVTDVASPVTCVSGVQYDNVGAGGAVTYNLPTCAREERIRFVRQADQTMTIQVAAGDQAHANGVSTTVAGTFDLGAQYTSVEVIGINDTDWIAVAGSGTLNNFT